ncbi:MAG TPA: P-loop NTPase, partial [Stenomitos sp.]
VIAGTVPLTEAIQEMPGYENLHILFAGAVALDPTSILSSQKMRSLMQDCRGQFDLVIYDTPPLSFADALLLIAQTDGLLMVTQLGKIHRGVLRNAIQLLETSKVPVMGVVANMASDDQFATGSAYYRKSSEQAKVLAS